MCVVMCSRTGKMLIGRCVRGDTDMCDMTDMRDVIDNSWKSRYYLELRVRNIQFVTCVTDMCDCLDVCVTMWACALCAPVLGQWWHDDLIWWRDLFKCKLFATALGRLWRRHEVYIGDMTHSCVACFRSMCSRVCTKEWVYNVTHYMSLTRFTSSCVRCVTFLCGTCVGRVSSMIKCLFASTIFMRDMPQECMSRMISLSLSQLR